ncbi:hypothetical protein AX14_011070 [Amanita brunnescens Koide BX004]|nr:hypothetical protein AX14_011070 [Amanita brunnescens Koide BX004]
MRQNGYGRIWTNGICGEGGGVVFEQSAGMNELEVGSGEMDEVGDAGTQDSEGRVGRRGIEDEPRIVSFGRATLERKVYFSRASLMTSGILNLPLLTMSAEPEPEHPVRQQRSLRPVATLIASRSAAPPIPASLQAKLLALASRGPATAPSATAPSVDDTTAALQATSIAPDPVPNPVPIPPRPAPPRIPPSFSRGRLRPGFTLKDIASSSSAGPSAGGAEGAGLGAGRPSFAVDPPRRPPPNNFCSPFSNFSKIVDPNGALNFNGKAVLHAAGVNFSNGAFYLINMGEMQLDEELGKGNYGTVKKVLHKPTNVFMAMKEIRLELDEAKLNAIIMELDILHRAVAPEIIEFYGAFFIETCVYYCMEYMDAGSLDKLQAAGVPEDVLGRIAGSMVRGLKFLKDELQIIHRDVKPTNVLVNRKGQIKLCDFGASGQLEKSLAKTNIGCQSYMAVSRLLSLLKHR